MHSPFLRGTFAILLAVAAGAQAPPYREHGDLLYVQEGSGGVRSVRSPQDWAERRAHIVAHAEEVMGAMPSTPRSTPRMQVLEERRMDGFLLRKITYEALDGDPVPAYLLLPDTPGQRPAVLALHPTGPLGKGIVMGESERENRNYGEELARRGYVVLAPDYPTMGDPQTDPYELGYVSTTMKGIYNHSRGVDLLASLERVDPERIGAIGHSLGGHNALFIALFDARIKAVVTSCGFNSFFQYYGGDLTGWSSSKYMPRIAERYGKDPARMPFDFTEVLAAIAPRPVFINAPVDDSNFEVTGVYNCLRAARPVYERVFDAGERLVAEHPTCGHDFPKDVRGRAYAFLDLHLAAK
ncbi:MAG: alpha/beta fold hydrolase [Bryobacterales bacterium]|nr:alpha/beta fold hydrolase [Bryobacterales bacterium]